VRGVVLDASAALSWCFEDETSENANRVLARVGSGEAVVVTAFWWYEILNVLIGAERRRRITVSASTQFLTRLRRMNIVAESTPDDGAIARAQSFARKHSLTAYDAAYLELALRREFDLATFDVELRRAAAAEDVTLV
jgi:predicted nucleic acid-binding protein